MQEIGSMLQRCHLVVEKKKEIVAKRSERSARPSRRGVQRPRIRVPAVGVEGAKQILGRF